MKNQKLKEFRENKNLTMKQVALKLGVTESCYCLWENGNRKPDLIMAAKIAKVFDVDVSEVVACFVPNEETA